MNPLTADQVLRLQSALESGLPLREAAPVIIGGTVVNGGFWRFFSSRHPTMGIDRWNEEWCATWALPKDSIFVVGEDVFGNQLLLTPKDSTMHVCDHENGACHNLDLGPADLLGAVLRYRVSWIDFYSNGSPAVAAGFLAELGWEQHLHWTHPLVLGGSVTAQNVSVVERLAHLHGHAKLWARISGLEGGGELVI